MIKNFRTYELAKAFYKECKQLKFKQPMKNQFERAILSILLNLAEGSGKRTSRDRKNFYTIAMGSLREVQAMLDLEDRKSELNKSEILGAHLYKLIQNPGGS